MWANSMLLLWLLGGFWYLRLHPLGEQVLVHRGLFSFFIDMERLSVYKNGLIGRRKERTMRDGSTADTVRRYSLVFTVKLQGSASSLSSSLEVLGWQEHLGIRFRLRFDVRFPRSLRHFKGLQQKEQQIRFCLLKRLLSFSPLSLTMSEHAKFEFHREQVRTICALSAHMLIFYCSWWPPSPPSPTPCGAVHRWPRPLQK